jgi:general secretion pathway protein F
MSQLFNGGYSLSESMSILKNDTSHREAVISLQNAMENGSTFSEALSSNAKKIDPFIIFYLQSAEKAGDLEKGMSEISSVISARRGFSQSISELLFYPRLIVFIGMVLLNFLCLIFFPFMSDFFTSLGIESVSLVRLAQMVYSYRWVMAVFDCMCIYALLNSSLLAQLVPHRMRKVNEQLWFFNSLGNMLRIGMPISVSLKYLLDICSNGSTQKEKLDFLYKSLSEGKRLSASMSEESSYWGRSTVTKMAIAEKNDSVALTLQLLGNELNEERKVLVARYTQLFRTVSVIVLGLLVYGLTYSVYKPMVDILVDLGGI